LGDDQHCEFLGDRGDLTGRTFCSESADLLAKLLESPLLVLRSEGCRRDEKQ